MTEKPPNTRSWNVVVGRFIVEVGSIVLAVLLALLADEWREENMRKEMAELAMANVAEEVSTNLVELESSFSDNTQLLEYLREAAKSKVEGPISVDMALSLVSSAAWESAKMTQAVSHVEFGHVSELAKYYDQLRFFANRQDQTLTLLGQIGQTRSRAQTAETLIGQIQVLLSVQSILIESSAELLELSAQ